MPATRSQTLVSLAEDSPRFAALSRFGQQTLSKRDQAMFLDLLNELKMAEERAADQHAVNIRKEEHKKLVLERNLAKEKAALDALQLQRVTRDSESAIREHQAKIDELERRQKEMETEHARRISELTTRGDAMETDSAHTTPARNSKKRLNALLRNGEITQEDYDELMQELDEKKEVAAARKRRREEANDALEELPKRVLVRYESALREKGLEAAEIEQMYNDAHDGM